MLRNKPIAGFLIRFVLVYAVLMAPWPGVKSVYQSAFSSGWSFVFGTITSPETVRLAPLESADRMADTTLFVRHRHVPGIVNMTINCRQTAYLPTAVAMALLLATPIPWPRRVKALCWGLALVHLFIGLRLVVMLLYGAYRDVSPPDYADPGIWVKTVAATVLFVGTGQALSYIGPIFIWLVVALRRDDLTRILQMERRSETSGSKDDPSRQQS